MRKHVQILVEFAVRLSDDEESLTLLDVGPHGGSSTAQVLAATPARVLAVEADRIAVDDLRRSHPTFDRVRLVNLDTCGDDLRLVPAIAQTWRDCTPALFLAFGPNLSAASGQVAAEVWQELSALGYSTVGLWDNGGHPIGHCSIAEIPALFADSGGRAAYSYVAVAHETDVRGTWAIEAMLSPVGAMTMIALRPGPRRAAIAAVAAACVLGGVGTAAAAGALPDSIQERFADFSHRVLPFDFPQPSAHPTSPAPTPASVAPTVPPDARASLPERPLPDAGGSSVASQSGASAAPGPNPASGLVDSLTHAAPTPSVSPVTPPGVLPSTGSVPPLPVSPPSLP